ncbi:MAG: flagellar brake protein [Gallionellaceae bacterium]|nr:MAG: flagellar brake protein [Gallionellaceae bacterium]
MSLIQVNSSEIAVGKPVSWTLYDQEQTPLLASGEMIRDETHKDALLAAGACRELSWETSGTAGKGDDNASAAQESPLELPAGSKPDPRFTFDDMKLKTEDRLQLEPPAQLARERFTVKVIGFLREASLLVTMPITANGLRLQLMENEKVVMRSFSGQNAFGFACAIERIIKIPYEYLHLSFPDNIQGIVIRKAPRVKTRIIATVQDSKAGAAQQVSALISDISANGVSLEARRALGNKGDLLVMAFRVQLHNIDAYLSVKGAVRAVFNSEAADTSTPPFIRHGIEFQDLQPNDSVVLQSMIYQQMIENPHKLV